MLRVRTFLTQIPGVGQHGAHHTEDAGAILERVTGQRLTAENWLRYVRGKFVSDG